MNLIPFVATIIFLRRLSFQQYANWMGILLSNLFFLVTFFLENTSALLEEDHPMVYLSIFPVFSLMVNIIISLLDLSIFINFTDWYKKNINKVFIITVQIASFELFCLIIKDYYFWGPLLMNFKKIKSVLNFGLLFTIMFIFIVALLIHYKWIRENLEINIANDNCSSVDTVSHFTEGSFDGQSNYGKAFVGIFAMNPEKLSLVEMDLAHGLLFNGMVFLVFGVLVLLASLASFSLFIGYQSSCDCWPSLFTSVYYLCMFFTCCYSAVFSPIGFVVYSYHFKLVLKQICRGPRRSAPMVQSV